MMQSEMLDTSVQHNVEMCASGQEEDQVDDDGEEDNDGWQDLDGAAHADVDKCCDYIA